MPTNTFKNADAERKTFTLNIYMLLARTLNSSALISTHLCGAIRRTKHHHNLYALRKSNGYRRLRTDRF